MDLLTFANIAYVYLSGKTHSDFEDWLLSQLLCEAMYRPQGRTSKP